MDKLTRISDEEIPYGTDCHLDAGIYDSLLRRAFIEGAKAQLDADNLKLKKIKSELEKGMAGLALDHPEYYERRAFNVIPSALWDSFWKKVLGE